MTREELRDRFRPALLIADEGTIAVIEEAALTLAECISSNTPNCREQTVSLSRLEEAVFWAFAAAARHG